MASLGLGFSARVVLPSIRSLIPALPLATLALPAIQLNIPTLLPGIFESILRAVPKKKQSHSRKRMRQLAGKALKDVVALNNCPACGAVKRKNRLCEPCVESIKGLWKKRAAEESTPVSSPS
jgi:superkiller protein 8